MNIRMNGKKISTNTARAVGVAVVDLAASVDRYNVQQAQANAHPTIKREADQASAARARAVSALHRLQDAIAEATA
jgi:hypothetical protein